MIQYSPRKSGLSRVKLAAVKTRIRRVFKIGVMVNPYAPTSNPGLFWLAVFVIVVLLVGAGLVLFLLIKKAVDEFSVDGKYQGPSCVSNAIGNVPDISSRPCCCPTPLIPANAKFVSEVNLIGVPDDPTAPIAVCSQYCTNFVPGAGCSGPSSNDYQACLTSLTPQTCQGVANPIAFNNGVAYYGYQINPCSSTWDCNDLNQCASS
jgi:hypothetical protein